MLTAMSPSAADLDQARCLVDGGSPGAAVTLLRRSLSGRNPYLEPVNAGSRDLAEFYVGLTVDDPAEADRIGWVLYLHRATLRAGGRLPAGEMIAARFSAAKLLHSGGLCQEAEREVCAALSRWAPHHNDGPDVTCTHLADALALLDQCGRIKQGKSMFHAYGGMLPAAGTDEYALLHSQIRLKLGSREDIRNHEDVCGIRLRRSRPRRRSYGDLRRAVLDSLSRPTYSGTCDGSPTTAGGSGSRRTAGLVQLRPVPRPPG